MTISILSLLTLCKSCFTDLDVALPQQCVVPVGGRVAHLHVELGALRPEPFV